MAGWTNRGKYKVLGWSLRQETMETNLYVALVKSTPDCDDNLMSDLTEIAAGNGYTAGGFQLTPNSTDFDTWTEDDSGDKGLVKIKNVYWTASGGPIPSDSNDATYAVLTDDNATVANREVYHYWNITDSTVLDGAILQLEDLEISIDES